MVTKEKIIEVFNYYAVGLFNIEITEDSLKMFAEEIEALSKVNNVVLDAGIKYRTPSFNEMVVGFKCQTCYGQFTKTDDFDEWVDIEFTQDFYDTYMGLIEADSHETEFRVEV
jgi:hypothetical protein